MDDQILAELGADEKVSEEEVAEEIESGRLKADATQTLAAIEERLAEQTAVPPSQFTISTATRSDGPKLEPKFQPARQPTEGSKSKATEAGGEKVQWETWRVAGVLGLV